MAHEIKRSHESTRFDRFEHYNFLGNLVRLRSDTPAAVSLYVQMSYQRKVARDPLSREGVILSQGTKYIDPVGYDGPQEHLLLEGTACRDRVTGYAAKLNDPEGTFGDVLDGETAIKSQGVYLPRDRMQHPYIMDVKQHAFNGKGDLIVHAPGYSPPKDSSYKRDTTGRVIRWNDGVTSKSAYIHSKLSSVETVEYEADEGDNSGPMSDGGLWIGAHKREEQETMTEQADEEYSPFRPSIPGFRATHQECQLEEWQPEEVSDEEADRCVDEIFAKLAAAANRHPIPTYAENSDYTESPSDVAFSAVNVPLSPVRFTSHTTTGKQHGKTETLEAEPMTRASSGSSADYESTSEDESYPSSGATTPDHAAPATGIESEVVKPGTGSSAHPY
ncbi:MAG: hypothetical protein Q9194_004065 [Teloschistes cf. exilis]